MHTGTRPVPADAGERTVRVRRPIWLSATALACALAAIRLALAIFADYDRVVGLFDDDAFYYFGVAAHVAGGDGSTFNGMDPTNGYHPLWLLLLVPVFSIAHGHAALVAVTLVSAGLFVASARQIDRIGALTQRPALVTVCSAPLLVVGTAGPSFWFSGMETGLLLFALLWLAATYLRTEGFTAAGFGAGEARVAGALMALAVLSRLDAVFPMVLLGVLALLSWRRAGLPWLRLGAWLAVFPVVVLAGYLAVNQALFGTPMPVSGQAKALGGAGGLNTDVVGQFLTSPVLFGQSTWLGAIGLVVVIGALTVKAGGALGRAAVFGAIVLGGGLLTVVYYAVTTSWQLWPWYFSAAPLAIALAGPALASRVRVPARGLVAIGVILLVAATTSANAVRSARGGVARSAFIEAGPAVAAKIDALTPFGLPMAMGDRAGSLGFHLHRPLVHLEGLVNSAEYLDALRDGGVAKFLAARDVALYARGDASAGTPVAGEPGCVGFTEPQQGGGTKFTVVVCDQDLLLTQPLSDGTSYRVWRYRPNLQPG
ncbi:MAG TPA: hypothetical protein VM677_03405 [Actinokineospora sp.]|nr:hypothetical protein [Actinokineospora sp.]